MKTTKEMSVLRGLQVVSRDEGTMLGSVVRVFVSASTRRVSALSFKDRNGDEKYLEQHRIVLIGKDVVLVSSESDVKSLAELSSQDTRSLKDLQGTWVATMEGKHLGTLVDLDIDDEQGTISELRLENGKRLPIQEPNELTLGPDQILVAAHCEARLVESEPQEANGLLGRFFGNETIDEVKAAIRRALQRKKESSEAMPATDESRPTENQAQP